LPDLSISPRRIVAVRSPETDEVLVDTMYVSVESGGWAIAHRESRPRAACGDWCGEAKPVKEEPSMEQNVQALAKPIKVPGSDHPISIERSSSRVVVSVAGRVIADTREALTLHEAHHPAVQYIPRKDVDMTLLARTDRTTYCPYKGDANYFSIPAGGERSIDAVWTYESPYAAVADIKDHLAFYPDRVDAIEIRS
jgi:uncharacterized protein (DUF427 family)